MPSVNTHGDSLTLLYTGASTNGGAQTDPALCLGNYASATEVNSLLATISNPIPGITIAYVDGANGTGAGTLTALDANTLAWTPPGGTQGLPVTISNGESKLIEGGGADKTKYIQVSRTSAVSLSGTATVTLAISDVNPIGMAKITTTEQTSGSNKYRAIMIKNTSTNTVSNVYVMLEATGTQNVSGAGQLGASGAGTISIASGNFDDWPESGFCRIESVAGTVRENVYFSGRTSTALTVPANGRGLLGTTAAAGAGTDIIHCVPGSRIASEIPISNQIQTIPDEDTAPTGVTWKTGILTTAGVQQTANAISIGSLAAGAVMGLWLHRLTVAGSTPTTLRITGIALLFDAS